jgi:predicted ATP-grasp superfamily ATP-dependent carboligase
MRSNPFAIGVTEIIGERRRRLVAVPKFGRDILTRNPHPSGTEATSKLPARNSQTRSPRGVIILGGAHGSLEIARSLGRRGIPVWFVIADNPLPSLSRYVERSISWAGPHDGGALTFLKRLARNHGLKGWVMFAGGDQELRFVAQNHSALSADFTLTTPVWDTIQWTLDKQRMNARAAALGIPQPLTRYPLACDHLAELGLRFPVVLKPTVHAGRNAFVDAKAWRADDLSSLVAQYGKAESLVGAGSIMVQELIPGDGRAQFSYASVWDHGTPIGSLVARRRRQYPIDFGYTSTLVETVELEEIEKSASRFLKSLDYTGLVEIEFKYDSRDGAYKILDVNTRAWTWIALGAAAGIDFPAIQWQLAMGEKVAPVSARLGANWVFFPRDFVASVQEMLGGTLSPIDYLRSLRSPSACAVFAWDDPWPAALELPLVAARVALRRLSRRKRGGSTPYTSSLKSNRMIHLQPR